MPIEIDPQDPLGSLKAAGVTYTTTQTGEVSQVSFGGAQVNLGGGDGVRFDMALPADSGLKVLFGPERFGTQLSKIWKSELQAGDQEFDDTVYITTQTEDKVAALLKDDRIRNTVRHVILLGGTIGVDGSKVLYHIVGETTDSDAQDLAHFVATAAG